MRSHSFNQLHTALNHTITVIYCKHICTFKDSWERFLTYYLKVIYPNPLKTRLSINTVNIYPPSTPCTVVYSRCRRHIYQSAPSMFTHRLLRALSYIAVAVATSLLASRILSSADSLQRKGRKGEGREGRRRGERVEERGKRGLHTSFSV